MSSHDEPRGNDPAALASEMRIDQPHGLKPALANPGANRLAPSAAIVAAAPATLEADAVGMRVERRIDADETATDGRGRTERLLHPSSVVVSRAQRSTRRQVYAACAGLLRVVRCRPGTVAGAVLVAVPDQRCTASRKSATRCTASGTRFLCPLSSVVRHPLTATAG